MKHLSDVLYETLSGEKAKETTTDICNYYRSFGSAGYHTATNLVVNKLQEIGINDVKITKYPLDGKYTKLNQKMPLAWEPYSASLSINNPIQEEIVNFSDSPSCLAWWSVPTNEGGETRKLIDVGYGENENDFVGKEIKNNYVFIKGTDIPDGWRHAAIKSMEKGAKGLITDYLFYPNYYRTRENVPDAVQLLRLPNQFGKFNSWGCSIDYNSSIKLQNLLKLGDVYINADIQCKLFEGEGVNVEATIPGSKYPDECVMFIAHTSAGTRPGANCAAGPSLMLEIARTINELIKNNIIPEPIRSIKFLFIAEGKGSNVYIDDNLKNIKNIKTIFCFDSVGHQQDKLNSNLMQYKHPDSSPSFINDFFVDIIDKIPKETSWVFKNDNDISLIKFIAAPYTVWSDNHTWAAFGVPSPLIMSWPDKYFHTQLLTPDNTDPRVFKQCGIATAQAALEIANIGKSNFYRISNIIYNNSIYRLNKIKIEFLESIGGEDNDNPYKIFKNRDYFIKKLEYNAMTDIESIKSLNNFIKSNDIDYFEKMINELINKLKKVKNDNIEYIKGN